MSDLPHSPEAEMAVASCMALAPAATRDLCNRRGIGSAHFYLFHERELFSAAVALFDSGKPLDEPSLIETLRNRQTLEKVGGPEAVRVLWLFPTPGNLPSYLDALEEKHTRRQLAALAAECAAQATDEKADVRATLARLRDEGGRIADGQGKAPGSLPDIIWGGNFAAEEIVLPPEIIVGMLHQGGKMMLGGGSKSFKTWCLADLAISIASGETWWGMEVKQGRVLYINLEVQEAFFKKRLQTVAEAKGIAVPNDLAVWNLRGHCASHESLLPRIVAQIRGQEFLAIFLDPTYKVMRGAENDQEQVSLLMDSIEKLGAQANAAVIFGSHFAKGNASQKEAIDRVSGSGVFARDPDAIVMMTPHKEEYAYVIEPILRNCPPIEPFCLRWGYPLMRPAADLNAADLKQPPTGKKGVLNTAIPTPDQVADIVVQAGGKVAGGQKDKDGLVQRVQRQMNCTREIAIEAVEAAEGKTIILDRTPGDKGGKSTVYELIQPT